MGPYRLLHLRRGGDGKFRMGADTGGKVQRRQVLGFVAFNVISDLLLDGGQMSEPPSHLVGHPDPGQIGIAATVTEPATHLQESVVRTCRSDKERHA